MSGNGFLLVRCVLFSLLTFMSLLTLAFAGWNINSSLSAGQSASTTSALILFESCCFFVGLAMAFLEVIRPKSNTAGVAFECTWVALIALFQLGASISSTITASVFACRASSNADICASAFLLVPSMWIKTLLSFGYFISLFITALAHRALCENIWKETIYTVVWFQSGIDRAISRIDQDLEKANAKKRKESDDDEDDTDEVEDPYVRFFAEMDSAATVKKRFAAKDPEFNATAPWAQQAPIRRGVDTPFSTVTSPTTAVSKNLPPIPAEKAQGGAKGNSRFIEKFRESRILSRFELPSLYGTHFTNNGNAPFSMPTSPTTNQDADKPIPLPHVSEWVRAEEHRRSS